MMPYLIQHLPKAWTKIPNHNFEAFANRKFNIPYIEFRKGGKDVCLHVFCNEFVNPLLAFAVVCEQYTKYGLGSPKLNKDEPNWIHTVPIPGPALTPEENMLMHQITQSTFWTIYMDYKRIAGG